MKYVIVLDVEPNDTIEADAEFPPARILRRRLRDVLMDVTKHDETIGWRVVDVQSIEEAIDR